MSTNAPAVGEPQVSLSPLAYKDAESDSTVAFRFTIAWIFIVLVLWLINKTKVGSVIVFYALTLMLVFVLVTQYQWITWILQPLIPNNPATKTT